MSVEPDTRYLIDNILRNKKWILDPNNKDRNVFFERPKTQAQKRKLNGKKPDYILYKPNTDTPIAIIEAKKGGSDLGKALEQGTKYAKLLNVSIVFAMNGSYCETRFVPNNKPLILDNYEVNELLRETEVSKFLESNSNEAYTLPKEFIVSREDLIRIFKDLNDVLRGEGLRAGIERFSEFSNILFLKLLDENKEDSWWNLLKQQPDKHLIKYINGTVIKEIKEGYGGEVFSKILIKNPKTLRHIMDALDPLTLSTMDTDVKGDAFEYFLEKTTSTENDLGEYFTPRNIVKTIINLVDPQFTEKVYDPFCGTGGFLTSAFKYVKENNSIKTKDMRILKNEMLYGREITTTARIAKMNMILHGDGHSGVEQADSLLNPEYRDKEDKILKFDIVVTNMPFSQKITRKISVDGKIRTENQVSSLYYNGLAKNNGDATCVLHCLNSLKPGGRMALVVPEGFLFKENLKNVRKFLLSKAKLQSVISLPQGTFLPYTGVKTSILYFTNAHMPNNQKEYWFFNVKNIGVTLDNHKRKITGMNDLNKIDSSDIRKVEKDADLKESMLDTGFQNVELENVKNDNYKLTGVFHKQSKNSKDTSHQILQEDIDKKLPLIRLGDVLEIICGQRITKKNNQGTKYPVYGGGGISFFANKTNQHDALVVSRFGMSEECVRYVKGDFWLLDSGFIVKSKKDIILQSFMDLLLLNMKPIIFSCGRGAAQKNIDFEQFKNITIPVPSISEQQKIVDELDSYQKIIDGAKQILNNYIPRFDFEALNCKSVFIKELCNVFRGGSPRPIEKYITTDEDGLNWLKIGDTKKHEKYVNFTREKIKKEGLKKTRLAKKGSLILSNSMSFGRPYILNIDTCIHDGWLVLQNISSKVNRDFLYYMLLSNLCQLQFSSIALGSTVKNLNIEMVENVKIPIPSISMQEEIVRKLDQERKMIDFQKTVIEKFAKKIENRLDSLYRLF